MKTLLKDTKPRTKNPKNLKISLLFRQKTVLEAEAEAEAIALQGDAKAFAVEAKAKAEAEQMAKKADAWNEYGKAALMDMMLKVKFFFIRFHLGLETV